MFPAGCVAAQNNARVPPLRLRETHGELSKAVKARRLRCKKGRPEATFGKDYRGAAVRGFPCLRIRRPVLSILSTAAGNTIPP